MALLGSQVDIRQPLRRDALCLEFLERYSLVKIGHRPIDVNKADHRVNPLTLALQHVVIVARLQQMVAKRFGKSIKRYIGPLHALELVDVELVIVIEQDHVGVAYNRFSRIEQVCFNVSIQRPAAAFAVQVSGKSLAPCNRLSAAARPIPVNHVRIVRVPPHELLYYVISVEVAYGIKQRKLGWNTPAFVFAPLHVTQDKLPRAKEVLLG